MARRKPAPGSPKDDAAPPPLDDPNPFKTMSFPEPAPSPAPAAKAPAKRARKTAAPPSPAADAAEPDPRGIPAPLRAPPSLPEAPPVPGLPLESIAGIDPRIPPVLRENGYGDLWPSQQEAAPVAVAGENLVLAVPTASGKSLVAYLALLSRALKGSKGLYIVPLRALASEKFEDLKALGGALGLRVALAIGDLDAEDPQLSRYDIIVATSEKADALLRHKATWLTDMGCIVADEVHLLGDAGRGPTLEVLLARFKGLNPGAQIVALSATIANSRQLAQWLDDAKHIKTEWRPVTLREGILYGRGIQYSGSNAIVEVKSDQEDASLALTEDSVRTGGSVIVFVSTRKSTEALAEKLVHAVRPHLSPESRRALEEAAATLKGGTDETAVEKKLAKCILGGAAFHHAGLRNRERQLVERLFKAGHLRALSATPTLAAGVNLPARRVVVRDLFRYDVNEGNKPIPVLEYKQMAGRAGRPRYDKVGEAITIAKTREQKGEIMASFILAEPERVTSKLGTETALRTHVLSSIASEFVKDEATLKAFIGSTFYAFTADRWTLDERMTRTIDFLLENELIVAEGDSLEATRFGRRVSELYVDPMSAVKMRKALERVDKVKELTEMSFLHTICSTPDMIPIYVRRTDAWLEAEAMERMGQLLAPPRPTEDYDFFLSELKTACLLQDWIEEANEDDMLKKYNAYPGDVANKVDSARWLLYAMGEIARLFRKDATKAISQLGTRVEAGAKAEILPLIELKGVGRLRARRLYQAGYRSRELLGQASAADLARVHGIGPVLAQSILEQLGRGDGSGTFRLPRESDVDEAPFSSSGQRSLIDWG